MMDLFVAGSHHDSKTIFLILSLDSGIHFIHGTLYHLHVAL
jgi:hypothetical protein